MFQYGLVGNTIFYGGIAIAFGYIGWELHNITQYAAKIDEKQAKEILGLINENKTHIHKKKEITDKEIQQMAAKLRLEGKSVESIQIQTQIKDDFDSGKQADI
ncbi:transmembrane protein, putative (macronuclear) [Tetrahymena thermophila SB210]|uniref:Transmembrane protein, putative n=1 Tax=Tetrahymena thermophila (strain SB210) TaxID=312017 RepID=W7XH45_TETTS|nr:transmembrane protein, putative [Tetrahymena thermophila SB210]EWS72324.1 transmembrane protein, putative [Tetrahymena thermophila SB210]|eukprot:XP_012655132.1 transmembrane protein, putative [Tetrahymena thermophila SB210]